MANAGAIFGLMENAQVELVVYDGPFAMEAALATWLEEKAAVNNLLLGLLYRMSRRAASGAEVDALLIGVLLDGVPKLAFLNMAARTEMIMAAADAGWEPCLEAALAYFQSQNIQLSGLIGPDPQVKRFADAFAPQHQEVFRQKIMQLDQYRQPQPTSGAMRLATPADAPILTQWMIAFFKESLQQELSHADAARLVQGKLLEKSFFAWDDGGICAVAGLERPTRSGITVVLVYTPQHARGRGYASNLVGQMSVAQLRAGRRFLCLHTDADFPTSNKIYASLGYHEVGQGRIIHFKQA